VNRTHWTTWNLCCTSSSSCIRVMFRGWRQSTRTTRGSRKKEYYGSLKTFRSRSSLAMLGIGALRIHQTMLILKVCYGPPPSEASACVVAHLFGPPSELNINPQLTTYLFSLSTSYKKGRGGCSGLLSRCAAHPSSSLLPPKLQARCHSFSLHPLSSCSPKPPLSPSSSALCTSMRWPFRVPPLLNRLN